MKYLSLLLVLLSMQFLNAQEVNAKDGIAVYGYDLVAYFNNTPKPGSEAHSVNYKNTRYLFINNANKALFKANPEAYLPQFGGWCAYAIAQDGSKVKVNPKSYLIEDGKLYLFYNAWGINTRKKWLKNSQKNLKKARENWVN